MDTPTNSGADEAAIDPDMSAEALAAWARTTDPEVATRALRKFVNEHATNPLGFYGLAVLALRNGDAVQARTQVGNAFRSDPPLPARVEPAAPRCYAADPRSCHHGAEPRRGTRGHAADQRGGLATRRGPVAGNRPRSPVVRPRAPDLPD